MSVRVSVIIKNILGLCNYCPLLGFEKAQKLCRTIGEGPLRFSILSSVKYESRYCARMLMVGEGVWLSTTVTLFPQ